MRESERKCISLLLTRRIAIANGVYVSFCNQPKAHFGLPYIRPWDNRGKCHMDEKRIQCCLRAIVRYWSEIATFSYPPCI